LQEIVDGKGEILISHMEKHRRGHIVVIQQKGCKDI